MLKAVKVAGVAGVDFYGTLPGAHWTVHGVKSVRGGGGGGERTS